MNTDNYKRLLLLYIGALLLLCAVMGCSGPNTVKMYVNSKPFRFNIIETEHYKGFIIPEEYSIFGPKYWGIGSDTVQHLSIRDIDEAEKLIGLSFKNNLDYRLNYDISEYWRRYWSERDSNGNRCIRIDLRCSVENMPEEMYEINDVTDGRECDISVYINLDSLTIEKIDVDMMGTYIYDMEAHKIFRIVPSMYDSNGQVIKYTKVTDNYINEAHKMIPNVPSMYDSNWSGIESTKTTDNYFGEKYINDVDTTPPVYYPKYKKGKIEGFIDVREYTITNRAERESFIGKDLHVTEEDIAKAEKLMKKKLSKRFKKWGLKLSDFWRFYIPEDITDGKKNLLIYLIKGKCPSKLTHDPWNERTFSIEIIRDKVFLDL